MYEYKFIKVEVNRWKGKPKEDYKELLKSIRSKDGSWFKYLLLLFQVMGQPIILILFLKKKYKCFSTKKAGSYIWSGFLCTEISQQIP